MTTHLTTSLPVRRVPVGSSTPRPKRGASEESVKKRRDKGGTIKRRHDERARVALRARAHPGMATLLRSTRHRETFGGSLGRGGARGLSRTTWRTLPLLP